MFPDLLVRFTETKCPSALKEPSADLVTAEFSDEQSLERLLVLLDHLCGTVDVTDFENLLITNPDDQAIRKEWEGLIESEQPLADLKKVDLPAELKLAVAAAVLEELVEDLLHGHSIPDEVTEAVTLTAMLVSLQHTDQSHAVKGTLDRLNGFLQQMHRELPERDQPTSTLSEQHTRSKPVVDDERQAVPNSRNSHSGYAPILRSLLGGGTGDQKDEPVRLQPLDGARPLAPLMPQVQQHAVLAGEAQQQEDRIRRLIRQFESALSQRAFSPEGVQRLAIRLHPEHLGRMDVVIIRQGGSITAKIAVSAPLTKDAAEQNLHQLRQAFLNQNLNVERIEISQMPGVREDGGKEREQSQSRKENRSDHIEDDERDSGDEEDRFRTILENTLDTKA
jgi:flagellar hook-length control protein FliK